MRITDGSFCRLAFCGHHMAGLHKIGCIDGATRRRLGAMCMRILEHMLILDGIRHQSDHRLTPFVILGEYG
jgi:hypothetical protein